MSSGSQDAQSEQSLPTAIPTEIQNQSPIQRHELIDILREERQQYFAQQRELLKEDRQQLCEVLLKWTEDGAKSVTDPYAFRKLGLQEFSGTEDAVDSDNWIRKTESRLKLAKIPQTDWLEIVQLYLIEPATSWWISEVAQLTDPISWDGFTTCFHEKYVTSVAKRHLHDQFLNLKQGSMTVDEYDDMYNVSGRFADSHVRKQKDRTDRFVFGLRQPLRPNVASHRFDTQREARNAARDMEDDLIDIETSCHTPSLPVPPTVQATSLQTHVIIHQPQPVQMICSFCKQPGHFRRDCPNKMCQACGMRGHYSNQCPTAGQTSHSSLPLQSPRPRKTRRGRRLCDLCRRSGHLYADCPDSPMIRERQGFSFLHGTNTTSQ